MSILLTLMLILLSILCVFSFNHQRLENDTMCKVNGILSVKDELIIIATIAKGIARISNEIEKKISQIKALDTLNRNVNTEMDYTRSYLPISRYHNEFHQYSNIDKTYLNGLVSEAHNAMIYYYNSINDLLNLRGVFAQTIDEEFKKIQYNMRYEIICRYRSILDVYSHNWKSVNEIGRIQFSKHRLSPSVVHDVHSVVIVRYLQKWMKQINDVIINLEMKFL